VTILINNAGIVSGKKILDISVEMAELTLKVNCLSHVYTVKEFMPDMIKKNHGHIVTIASSAGHVGVPGLVDYCASKFGAVGFDEALRLEITKQGYNIDTTCVCPTFIDTGMFKGASTKYEFLVPILKEDWVSERIVTAIRQREPVLLTPFMSNTGYLSRALLPTWFFDRYLAALGVNDSMDHFTGRK
jgi:all-trans-retinol dehydrogenase (NAD+)